ncbi:hypothetical protein D0T50_03995 [Bacteroides sp. 214]|nr:hypothetical protein [Bacteroides sp. 214]
MQKLRIVYKQPSSEDTVKGLFVNAAFNDFEMQQTTSSKCSISITTNAAFVSGGLQDVLEYK